MKNTPNDLIEEQAWIINDLDHAHCCIVSLGNTECRELVGADFCWYFDGHPIDESDKYIWETKRVDGLQNLYIWVKLVYKTFVLRKDKGK